MHFALRLTKDFTAAQQVYIMETLHLTIRSLSNTQPRADPGSGAATKVNPSIGAKSTPTVDRPSTV